MPEGAVWGRECFQSVKGGGVAGINLRECGGVRELSSECGSGCERVKFRRCVR